MIRVFSKPDCPFCVKAKAYLTDNGFDFEEVNVLEDAEALAFIKSQGHKKVPQLYVGDNLLVEGGYTGLVALGVEGLKERLAS